MKWKKSWVLLAFWGWSILPLAAQEGKVERAAPPHWWVGMENQELQVLVYGPDIASHRVRIEYPGVKLLGVRQVENPNYLFLDLSIAKDAEAGNVQFHFSNGSDAFDYTYELKERQGFEGRVLGLSPADFIYLIMPDRFANGDPQNDVVAGMNEETINRKDLYKRHGGDLQGITQKLDYIESMGVTAIWLNPVLENDQPKESYHGYAATDLYKVDARFGGNAAYREFIEACHGRGIKVVMDIIHNHWGNEHWLIKDLPFKDWVHQWEEFTRTTYRAPTHFDPYASEFDKKIFANGWFDVHMPDLNQANELVANYLIQNNIWWIEEFGIDAFRMDTYAYSDLDFLEKWGKAVMTEYPQFMMFGETWVHGVPTQAFYHGQTIMEKGFDSYVQGLTDFQLNYALLEALNGEFGWTDGVARLYYTLAKDYVYANPYQNVIFLDNHDVGRIYSQLGEDVTKLKSAVALMLTLRGIPNLYYGTEILMGNLDDHKGGGSLREDFPGGFPKDKINKFEASGRTDAENDFFNYVKTLGNYRKQNPALQTGKLMQFVPEEGIYTFFRYDEGKTVMVMFNGTDEAKSVDTARFAERMAGFTKATEIPTGKTITDLKTIGIPARTAWVLELGK